MADFPAALNTSLPDNDANIEGHTLDNLDGAGLDHSSFIAMVGQEIKAIEAKVGIDGSAVTTTLDYHVQNDLPDHEIDPDPHIYTPIELEYDGANYPTRPVTTKSVKYVGTVQPSSSNAVGLAAGDRWDDKLGNAVVTPVRIPYVFDITTPVFGAGQKNLPIAGTWTLVRVEAQATTAPVGADLVFDLNKNGTTVWTTQSNRIKIVAGQTIATPVTSFNVPNLSEGDYLSLDVDQVGTTVAGANVVVLVILQAA